MRRLLKNKVVCGFVIAVILVAIIAIGFGWLIGLGALCANWPVWAELLVDIPAGVLLIVILGILADLAKIEYDYCHNDEQ